MSDASKLGMPASPKWSRSFVVDFALGELELMPLLEKHGITFEEFIRFKDHPQFTQEVESISVELSANGLTFKEKCKALADDFLADVFRIVKDAEQPASVRAGLIKDVVHWSGQIPKASSDVGGGLSFNLTIALGGGDSRVVSVVPSKVTHTIDNEVD